MFAGLVRCADCGSALNLSYDAKKQKYKNFSCWVYKNYGKQRCTSHAIGWKTMCELVLEDVRRNAYAANAFKDVYLNRLLLLCTDKQRKETERYKRELKSAEKRIKQLDVTISKLFEQCVLGRISEERYQIMMELYESEQRELKDRSEALSVAVEQAEEAYSNVEDFVKLIRKHTDIQELDAYILNSLIDKIVVHEKVILEDGSKSQRVDIYYKFIGYLTLSEILLNSDGVNGMPPEELTEEIIA